MIEVTKKDCKGRIQTIGFYTEKEFGESCWPYDVEHLFSTEHKMVGSESVYNPTNDIYSRVAIFSHVAYNHKGKILDVGYLLGLARKYNYRYNNYFGKYRRWYGPSGTKREKRRVRGSTMRQMRTTQERRWAHAWDDEEFAPKCRSCRNAMNLPEAWDDYWRRNEKNWKNYRKHQWKE